MHLLNTLGLAVVVMGHQTINVTKITWKLSDKSFTPKLHKLKFHFLFQCIHIHYQYFCLNNTTWNDICVLLKILNVV